MEFRQFGTARYAGVPAWEFRRCRAMVKGSYRNRRANLLGRSEGRPLVRVLGGVGFKRKRGTEQRPRLEGMDGSPLETPADRATQFLGRLGCAGAIGDRTGIPGQKGGGRRVA